MAFQLPPAAPAPQNIQPFPNGNPPASTQQEQLAAQAQPPQGQPPMPGQPPQPMAPPPKGPIPFDAPVPGQSLTDTPKNAPWEHPPQFTTLKDATNWLFDRFTNEDMVIQLLTLLESGMSVEDVARIVVFSGFMNGKWTVDLGMLLAKPAVLIITGIATRAGIKFKMTRRNKEKQTIDKLVKMANVKSIGNVSGVTMKNDTTNVLKGLMNPKGI
jgi:hypothetical protein